MEAVGIVDALQCDTGQRDEYASPKHGCPT
jgi:hypothetical protein